MFYNILAKRSFRSLQSIKKTNLHNVYPSFYPFMNFVNSFSSTPKDVGINDLGIINPQVVHRNLSYPELFRHEQANNEGVVMKAKYGNTHN